MSPLIYTLNMEISGLTVPIRRTIHLNIQNLYRYIAKCLSSNLVEIVKSNIMCPART